MNYLGYLLIIPIFLIQMGMGQKQNEIKMNMNTDEPNKQEKATLGAGCFWCVEAVYQQLKGVKSVTSGYSGGHVKNPSYREVTTGKTGHAEAVQITYDPGQISFSELLEVFWKTHDPTTLNRQGPDIGTQYRSVIFYHNEDQKRIAEESKEKMDQKGYYKKPIVTEVVPFKNFYVAEDYHQDFYKNNPGQPYCKAWIDPKMEKLQDQFGRLLK
jgi:peptide-methionine (S)-S-oxide reductase